jgi:hypothetical protein
MDDKIELGTEPYPQFEPLIIGFNARIFAMVDIQG